MRILIVVPDQDQISGNWVTAQRFQQGLKQQGHQVASLGVSLQPQGLLRRQLQAFVPDVALLLHAYRSGKPWLEEVDDLNVPCVVLLTGTDVNHGLDDPAQRDQIRTVLRRSRSALVQNPLIAAALTSAQPELSANLHILTPGITLGTAPYDLRHEHALAMAQVIFLCPAGLRPVKGLLELLEMSVEVASANPAFVLAFCGPTLDDGYSRRLLTAIECRPWARYLGAIPPEVMASAMRGVDVVVNNSQSEGLANALLEAAVVGIPILARRIPGNAAVVRHNVNGLLYGNEAEFQSCALQLLDPRIRRQLACPEPERYPARREAEQLAAILKQAIRALPAVECAIGN
jgi:glycosyltransferase involved in cell wall biosynthesis